MKSWPLVLFSSILITIIVLFFLSLVLSPGLFFEAEKLPSNVGTVSKDPLFSGGAARYAMSNNTGFQVYGPYISLEQGDCIAKYSIWIQEASPGDAIATFDVYSGTVINRTAYIADSSITNLSKIDIYLPFYSNGGSNFEFRVYKEPGVELWVDTIEINPTDDTKQGHLSILKVAGGIILVLFLVLIYLFNRYRGKLSQYIHKAVEGNSLKTLSCILFVAVWLFYIALVLGIFGPTHSPITGDEPHYVLATHSLVYDGDLDLRNNYENRDYAAFYGADLGYGHTALNKNGELFPAHEIGLSIISTIPYALLGVMGIKLLMTFIVALLILNIFLLLYQIFANFKIAGITSLIIAFTSPILFYSYSIYPETIVALCLVVALRIMYDFIQSGSSENKKMLLTGLLLGFLPWFGIKYVAISLPLVLLFGYLLLKDKYDLFSFITPIGISYTAYLLYLYSLFGTISSTTRYTGLGVPALRSSIGATPLNLSQLLAYFFGEQRGLLVYSPVYILFFIGVLAVILNVRRKPDLKFMVIALASFLSYYAVYASSGSLGGWCPPSRPMVAVIPIISVFVGYGVLWMSQARLWATLSSLALVSVCTGVFLFRNQSWVFDITKADGIVLKITNILPGFPTDAPMNWILLSCWLLLLLCVMILEFGLNNLLGGSIRPNNDSHENVLKTSSRGKGDA